MTEFKEVLKNNKNDSHYIIARNRVHTLTDKDTMKPSDSEEHALSVLDATMMELRIKNLRVFKEATSRLRKEKISIYVIPAVILAANIAAWVPPTHYQATSKLDNYERVETTVKSDGTVIQDRSDKYYYAELLSHNFVDKENQNVSMPKNRIYYTATNGDKGVRIEFDVNSDGKLSYSSSETGMYTDFDNTKNTNEEVFNVYSSLFDDIVDYVANNKSQIRSETVKELKELSQDEKTQVVINIIEYNSIGKKEVDVYKSKWLLRIILGIVALITGGIWSATYKEYEHKIHYFYDLKYDKNGKLYIDDYDIVPMRNLLLRYQEAFIEAEKIRIKRAKEAFDKNIDSENEEIVFTEYERNEILKRK